ncbi:MAG: hypothetical protein ACJ76V_16050 [Thermoleophilaceae bacterium]
MTRPLPRPICLLPALLVAVLALAPSPSAADTGDAAARVRAAVGEALSQAGVVASSAEPLPEGAVGNGAPAYEGDAPVSAPSGAADPSVVAPAAPPATAAPQPPEPAQPQQQPQVQEAIEDVKADPVTGGVRAPVEAAPPAPERPAAPTAPAEPAPTGTAEGPSNTNVVIRILSPGDDGPVTQGIELGSPTGPTGGGGLAPPRDWKWTWTCGGSPVATAAAGWDWTWTFDPSCFGAADKPTPKLDLPSPLDRWRQAPGSLEPRETAAMPRGLRIPGMDRRPPSHGVRHRPGRRAPHAGGSDGAGGIRGLAEPITQAFASGPAAGAPAPEDAPARSRHAAPRERHGVPFPPPGPLPFPPIAPFAASAGAAPSGAAALMMAALAGLLALAGSSFFTRMRPDRRRARSRLDGGRLERPG